MQLDTKEERQAFVENEVPEHLQEMVKTHVRCWWRHRSSAQNKKHHTL